MHALGGRVAAHVSGPGDAQAAIELGIDSLEHGPDVPLESLACLGRRGGAWTPTVLTVWRDGRSHAPMAAWQQAHYRSGAPADLVTYHDDPRNDPAILRKPAAILRRGIRIK